MNFVTLLTEHFLSEYKVEVLHRNELPINIRERNFLFPCVIVETDKELKEIINRAAFKDFENLSNVTELRKQLFEKLF